MSPRGLGLLHEQVFASSARRPPAGSAPLRLAGVCLALIAGRWRLPSPGNSRRSAGRCRRTAEGSPLLPVQVAFNARAALQSCELAALDFTPTRSVFEGPYGYLALFEGDFDLEPVLSSIGRDWRISELSHKPFPAGRATHGGIEGAMVLQTEHGFAPDDVERIEVIAPPLIARLVGRSLPPLVSATSARLCMGYAVAKVLQHGRLDPADFRGAALSDPVTHALAARVETHSDDNPDPNAMAPQAVVVHLTSGSALRWQCATMLANPARPLTREQHLAKFQRCCTFSCDRLASDAPERLVEMVDRLADIEDVRRLSELAGSLIQSPDTID